MFRLLIAILIPAILNSVIIVHVIIAFAIILTYVIIKFAIIISVTIRLVSRTRIALGVV